jgi:alkylation response protein AidB-like acyl-CoA dehydrogenase
VPIALTDEHEEQRAVAARWLATHCPPSVPRTLLDAETEELQPVWKELADQGWAGIHLPEDLGGQGFGLFELAVLLEESGYALLPGPFLPTVLASAAAAEGLSTGAARAVVPALAEGSATAGVFLGPGALEAVGDAGTGGLVVSGVLRPVLGANVATTLLVPVRTGDGDEIWCLLDVVEAADGIGVTPLPSLDPTRRVAEVVADEVVVAADRQLRALPAGRVRQLARVLVAAEHAGGARWCLETATEYAKVRRQFGRPIGQFQAVKHRLADMAVRVEQLAALAWDAAVAVDAGHGEEADLAAATAAVLALDGYASSAKECIQVLGGIGFTWEHDAHLHLKRAMADRQLLGDPDSLCLEVTTLAGAGARRALAAELPDLAEETRRELAPVVEQVRATPEGERRRAMVEAGLVAPHWPRPWGRDAGAVEQVVIDELLAEAGLSRPHLGIGAWAMPPIIASGTTEQHERWVRPTLLGELAWCQLFSEPGAGSDLAGLTTRAERGQDGWLLTGQKVWTSMARQADWGICLARTDPDAPKHRGITYFIVDMHAEGLDIRPLRELTGAAMFNEVFLDSVFVPDDCVIGDVNEGWALARVTLANERVNMSSGSTFGIGVESLIRFAARLGDELSTPMADRLGRLLVEAQSLQLMTHRSTLRSLAGTDPGSGASLRKLLGAEHEQRVQELGLAMLGPEGATLDGRAARWGLGFLATRCLTIAGGTSEVQRNVIAERILGLPRDPEPGA